jgi:hypothetical protein
LLSSFKQASQFMPSSGDPPFSAFHGRPLAPIKDDLGIVPKLAEVGIFDVEQFVGLGAISSTTALLAAHLGISQTDLSAALALYKTMLPDELNAELGRPVDDGYFSLGAFLTESPIRYSLKKQPKLSPKKMPSSVSHIAQMFPIQDQGVRGTCVAFGASALHEFFARKSAKPSIPQKFSEQFLYQETKLIDGSPNCGTWLSVAVMQVLNNLGQCPEQFWAYNPNLPCNNNGTEPSNARAFARNFPGRGQMLDPNDVNGLKVSLVNQSVVAFCIPTFNSWYSSSAVKLSGQITMPLANEALGDGHCLCAVGYQDDGQYAGGGYFMVRNSWGTSWASKSPYGAGYGTIPYQYLAQFATEAAEMPQRGGGPVSARGSKAKKRSRKK